MSTKGFSSMTVAELTAVLGVSEQDIYEAIKHLSGSNKRSGKRVSLKSLLAKDRKDEKSLQMNRIIR